MSGDFEQRVKEEAERAINEQLGNSADSADSDDSGGGDLLTPSEIISKGWNTDDYNSFFATCREAGYGASECGEMWSQMDEPEGTGGRENPKPVADGHVLVVKEGSDASDIAATHLAQPAVDGELEVAPVSSDRGQELLESLDEIPDVPAHVHLTDDGPEVRPLKELFREFLLE